MTYEEALSHAEKEREAYEHKVADGKAFYAKYAEFWEIVVSSIGKQIAKKPIRDEKTGWLQWFCPSCGCVVGVLLEFKDHHCNCGQRILWEDEDGKLL